MKLRFKLIIFYINYIRSSKESPSENEDSEEHEEDDNIPSAEERSINESFEDDSSTQRVTPNYVNIRRTRLSTTTSRYNK